MGHQATLGANLRVVHYTQIGLTVSAKKLGSIFKYITGLSVFVIYEKNLNTGSL